MVKRRSKKPRPEDLKRMGHDDLPATVGLVKEVRQELIHEIQSVGEETKSIRHEIGSVRQEMSAMESRLDSKIEKVYAESRGTRVLIEEMRSENRIVLDGLKNVTERQDRAEAEAKKFREEFFDFLKTGRA